MEKINRLEKRIYKSYAYIWPNRIIKKNIKNYKFKITLNIMLKLRTNILIKYYMAIFDCFQYFNEEHIVDLRFNIIK